MPQKTGYYIKKITEALKKEDRYNKGLAFQIMSLAGSLRTLDIANAEIDELEKTTISTVSRYGNETLAPHPVFKTQKDAMDSITKQMKILGLTVEGLAGDDENDKLVGLTEKVRKGQQSAQGIVRRKKAKDDRRGENEASGS